MDDTRDVAQYREENVNQKVGIATALEEDTNWWQEDGKNDFANITVAITYVTTCSHFAAEPRRNVQLHRWSGRHAAKVGGAPAPNWITIKVTYLAVKAIF